MVEARRGGGVDSSSRRASTTGKKPAQAQKPSGSTLQTWQDKPQPTLQNPSAPPTAPVRKQAATPEPVRRAPSAERAWVQMRAPVVQPQRAAEQNTTARKTLQNAYTQQTGGLVTNQQPSLYADVRPKLEKSKEPSQRIHEEALLNRKAAPLPQAGPVKELTDAEYAALTAEQKAAVAYNTAVMNAQRDGGLDALLTSFGQDPKVGTSLTISSDMLTKLADPERRKSMADSLRYAGQYASTAAPEAYRFQQVSPSISIGASRLAQNISTGSGSVLGSGSTTEDQMVQFALDQLGNADEQNTLEQAAQWLDSKNAELGTTVTVDDVLNFARLRIDAMPYTEITSDPTYRNSYTVTPDSTLRQKPLDQLRAELGL